MIEIVSVMLNVCAQCSSVMYINRSTLLAHGSFLDVTNLYPLAPSRSFAQSNSESLMRYEGYQGYSKDIER